MNFLLLKAIREAGMTQKQLARVTVLNPSVISRAINGTWNLTDDQKHNIAEALGRKVNEIFDADPEELIEAERKGLAMGRALFRLRQEGEQ